MVKISIHLLALIAAAASVKSAQIYSCTVPNTIALTFDDGPTKFTNSLIEKLNDHDIKATFFINAHNHYPYADESEEIQNVIKKAYESGHQIASHTYEHDLPLEKSEMEKSFRKMDSWIKSVIGVSPRYFRAPGGECDSSCIQNIENLGYRIINWDVDTIDWKTDSEGSIEILNEAFHQNQKNYLILMHDSKEHSVEETVPWIIDSGMLEKYKFVTVAECLGEKSSMYKEGSSSSSSKTQDTNASNKNSSTTAGNETSNNSTSFDNTENLNSSNSNTNVSTSLLKPNNAVVDVNFSNSQYTFNLTSLIFTVILAVFINLL